MKRMISGLLGLVLLLTLCAPVALAEKAGTAGGAAPIADLPEVTPHYTMVWGTITKVDVENGRVTLQLGANDSELILNVDEGTYIVDNVNHAAAALKSLKVGDVIYAWHSPVMTMSLPAQTYCYVMTVNIPADMQAGQFFEVEKVEKTKDGYRLLNQQQDLYLTVPAGTKVSVFHTKMALDISTVKPGTKLMAWYGMVAESYPAQASTTELILFPYDYSGYVQVDGEKIVADGQTISKPAIIKDGVTYLPMQDVARKLGFRTSYSRKTGVLTLKKDGLTLTFKKGADTFTAGDQEVATEAPYIVKSTLYVPMNAVNFLGDVKLATPVR